VVSSIAWGLYSNLNRKIVGDADYDAVGLFMVITGLLSYGVTFFVAEPQVYRCHHAMDGTETGKHGTAESSI